MGFGASPQCGFVSRWCRCIVQRLCATDDKHPCFMRAAAPRSASARMPGVYATRLCRTQSQSSIHSPSPRGRGLWFRQGRRYRTPKGFARTQSPQSVLKGIENLLYFIKTDFYYKLSRPHGRLFCNTL